MRISIRFQIVGLVAFLLVAGISGHLYLMDARASEQLAYRSVLVAVLISSLALLASIYFSRRLTAPLRALQGEMARISRGELGRELPVSGGSELSRLTLAFNEMSRELEERERALEEKSAQLIQSEKLSALGELAAGVAHEVKNPMVGVLGFAQLGQDASSLEEAREYFGLIEADAHRANEILQNLLEFARPQKVEMLPLDANQVVESAVKLVAHQLRRAGVALRVELEPGLPPIRGDGKQLRQVLLNLLMNAAQAMESVKNRQLSLATCLVQDEVVIEVRDTGAGMSEEVRKHLFNPFFSTKPSGKGTGLGLSVSRSIVRAHRGEIRVESLAGTGSVFFIRLPTLESSASETS